jgi:hypothetical protein
VSASGAQKGSWGAWAGVVAEDFGDVRERWSTAGAGGGGDLKGEAHDPARERASAWGQRLGDWRTRPTRQRGKRGARAKKPAPTAWPHWAASERERARGSGSCR